MRGDRQAFKYYITHLSATERNEMVPSWTFTSYNQFILYISLSFSVYLQIYRIAGEKGRAITYKLFA